MKKNVYKLLTACVFGAGIGVASAASSWTAVTEATMAGFKNTAVVKSFGFNSNGGLDLTDGFNASKPSNTYDRYAKYGVYGVTSKTTFIKHSDGHYDYGTASGGTETYIGGLYHQKNSQKSGYVFSFSSSGLQGLIDKAREKGYYKVRILVDSLSHADGGAYTSEFAAGKQRAHYVDYVIPPTFDKFGIDSTKIAGSLTKYSTKIPSSNYVHSRDYVWFSTKIHGEGSLKYFFEFVHTNYAKGSTVATTNTTTVTSSVAATPAGAIISSYFEPNDSWVKEGDENVKVRVCANTTKYTPLSGTAVTEKTCTDYVTIYVKNTVAVSSENPNMGTVSPVYSAGITASNGVTNIELTATPKAGYAFNCWKKNSAGACISTANPLKFQSMRDTVLVGSFKDAPLTAEFYPNYRKSNGAVVSAPGSSTSFDFVLGKDTLAFATKVSGAARNLHYVIQYRQDSESSWKDLYWYYASSSESAKGYEKKPSIMIDRNGAVHSISYGTLVDKNFTHGNSKTEFHMWSFYSDSTSYEKAVAGVKANQTTSSTYTVNWKYPVTLQNSNGVQISSANYAYNASFTFPTDKAAIGVPEGTPGEDSYTYSWVNVNNGSDRPAAGATIKIKAPVTYKVEIKGTYVVKFLDFDGSLWKSYNVDEYTACTTPDNPNHNGNTADYRFVKWDKSFSNISSYTVINAVYYSRVTFKGMDGSVLNNSWVAENTAATAPSAPKVDGYVFTGWDKDFSKIKDSITVTAKYVKVPVVEYTFPIIAGGDKVSDAVLTPVNKCIIPDAALDAELQGVRKNGSDNALDGDVLFVNNSSYSIAAAFTVSQDGECADDDLVKDFVAAAASGTEVTIKVLVNGNVSRIKLGGGDAAFVLANGTSFKYSFSAGNSYIITFLDADGETELSSGLVAEGVTPEAPTNYTVPENNAQYTYSFKNWNPTVVAATANATYIAQIDSVVNQYDVVFFDANGEEIVGSAQTVEYGSAAIAPAAPAKAGFVFTGWDQNIDFVESALNVKPAFLQVPEVKFIADDMFAGANNISVEAPSSCFTLKNVVLYDAAEEEMLSLDPDFAMEKDVNYVWKANVTMKTTDECVEDDLVQAILETASYADAVIPVKVNDIVANANIKANATKFALYVPFTAGAGRFTVTFAQADGSVIKQEKLEEGVLPTAPEASEIDVPEATARNTFTFGGWDKEIVAVTENVTYTAVIDEELNKYIVTFNYDGKSVLTEYEYGTMPVAPEDLSACPEGDAEFAYDCSWNAEFDFVTENVTYTYTVTKATAKYEVTYVFGEVSKADILEYGEMPAAPEDFKCAEKTAEKSYSCEWDKDFAKVTGNATYVYTQTATTNKYTITFKFGDVTKTAEVEYGKVPTAPEDFKCAEKTAEKSYSCEWDKDFAKVTGKATYTYTQTSSTNKYTITVSVNDSKMGSVSGLSKDGKYEYGAKVELVAKPASGYVFVGWSDDKKAEAKRTIVVSKNLKIEAKFEKKKGDAIIASVVPQFHMEVSGRNVAILGAKVGSVIAVLDMQGRVISKGRVDAANFSVTMPRAGMYIVRVNNMVKKVSVR